MSRENVEVVRKIWELWSAGPSVPLRAPYDEGWIAADSTFTPAQDVLERNATPYVGYAGFREFFRAWTEDWVDWRVRLEDVREAGDGRVVAIVHQSAAATSSGVRVGMRFGSVHTLSGGQVVDRRDYADAADALEAVGLSE